jgi:hypothetical protein
VKGTGENLRMFNVGPQSERGGMIACTRLPSDSRASTQGDDSSTRRPSGATILSITCRTASSPSNRPSVTFSSRPQRSLCVHLDAGCSYEERSHCSAH